MPTCVVRTSSAHSPPSFPPKSPTSPTQTCSPPIPIPQVRIKLKHMELEIRRRETSGAGAAAKSESGEAAEAAGSGGGPPPPLPPLRGQQWPVSRQSQAGLGLHCPSAALKKKCSWGPRQGSFVGRRPDGSPACDCELCRPTALASPGACPPCRDGRKVRDHGRCPRARGEHTHQARLGRSGSSRKPAGGRALRPHHPL